LEFKTRMTIKS